MKYIFLIIIPAVILGANLYVFYRLWHMIPQQNILARWALLAFAAVAVSAFFLALLAGGHMPLAVTGALYKLGTSWFLIMLYLVMIFLVLDLARATQLVPLRGFMHGSWTGLAVVAGAVVVVMTFGYIRYLDKDRVELEIRTGKTDAQGLKIVAVSDLHLGYGIGRRELAGWVELINAESPDVVLIAGDAVDNSTRPLIEGDFASELRRIKSKYGVFASLGNHEYIGGHDESVDFLRSAGITVLRDSAALVDSAFYIIGRDDRTNRSRRTLSELTDGLDLSRPVILLDHQPYDLGKAADAGIDLQISGHTHRGQVWPISWITDRMYEKSHGYMRVGGTHYYVTTGIGLWGGKYRIGTRSEYVVINLK